MTYNTIHVKTDNSVTTVTLYRPDLYDNRKKR
jgi:hypothetical protein